MWLMSGCGRGCEWGRNLDYWYPDVLMGSCDAGDEVLTKMIGLKPAQKAKYIGQTRLRRL